MQRNAPPVEEPPTGPPLPFGAAIASVLSQTVTSSPINAPPPSYDAIQGRAILLVVFPIIGFFCILSLALYCAQLVRNRRVQRRLGSNYLLNLAAMHDVVAAIQRHQHPPSTAAGGASSSTTSPGLVLLTRRPNASPPQPTFQLDDAAAAALAAAVLGGNQRGVRETLRRLYVQHRLMEDPGYQLTTWPDVQLAWAVWAAEEAAAGSSSAPAMLAPRCKRFPGLSPTLIQELPNWSYDGRATIPPGLRCAKQLSSDCSSSSCAAHSGEPCAPSSGQAQPAAAQEGQEEALKAAGGQQQTEPPAQEQQQQQQVAASREHLSITVQEPSSSSGSSGCAAGRDAAAGTVQERPVAAAEDSDDGLDAPTSCSICLDAYTPGDVLAGVPRCGHTFHRACLTSWLLQSGTCPNCRQVALPSPHCQLSTPPE